MARKRHHSPAQSNAQVEGHRGKHVESNDQTANSESQCVGRWIQELKLTNTQADARITPFAHEAEEQRQRS